MNMNIDKYNINIYGLTLFGIIADFLIILVVIGIVSLISFSKYQSLNTKANQAAVASMAGAISSASAINYVARTQNSPTWRNVQNCVDATNTLPGGLPVGYQIVGTNTKLPIANGEYLDCTIQGPAPANTQSHFVAIGAS